MNLKKILSCWSKLSDSCVYDEDLHDGFHFDQFFLGSYVAYHFHVSHFLPPFTMIYSVTDTI